VGAPLNWSDVGDYLVGKEQLGSVMDSKGTTRLLHDRLTWVEKGEKSETGMTLELLRGGPLHVGVGGLLYNVVSQKMVK
jgi:hypothetical protein